MKPLHISQFPVFTPVESDFLAIEIALEGLLQPIGGRLGRNCVKSLRRSLSATELPPKCTLMRAGETVSGIYFLVQGSLICGSQADTDLIQILRAGDLVLPLKLFSGERALMNIETVDSCRLLLLPARTFRHMMTGLPQAGILTHLWRDQLEEQRYLMSLAIHDKSAIQRIAWLYARWPDCFLIFTDAMIGAYLGLGRETVCRNKSRVIRGAR